MRLITVCLLVVSVIAIFVVSMEMTNEEGACVFALSLICFAVHLNIKLRFLFVYWFSETHIICLI